MDIQNMDLLTNTLQNLDLNNSDNNDMIIELVDELISRPQFSIKTDHSNVEFRVDLGHLYTTATTNFSFKSLEDTAHFIREYTNKNCTNITIYNDWGEEMDSFSQTHDNQGTCDINQQLYKTFKTITPEQVASIMTAGNYIYIKIGAEFQHIYINGGMIPRCHISEHTHSMCSDINDYTQEIFSCIKEMLHFYSFAGGQPRWVVE